MGVEKIITICSNGNYGNTVWLKRKFTLTLYWQIFRENNIFTRHY